MKFAVPFLLAAGTFAQAQESPPKLEYAGKPLAITAACTPELVQTVGLSCSAENPCPLFLELSSVEFVGNRVVLTGNLHTSSHTLESVLLTSEDSGNTWTEPYPRIPASVLDRIQFLDFEMGWINGHVLEKIPRDAFFLLTSDGGRTWRKRPLYGETRAGAIEQFYFDSRSHGMLLFDKSQPGENGMRHEMYESMTGGDSWSIRQVDSKPIPFKRPSAPPEAWRIRADAKLKAQVIERQQDSRWLPVASFLIAAGECKPVEPERPEAPPAVEPEAPPSQAPPPRQPPSLKKKNAR